MKNIFVLLLSSVLIIFVLIGCASPENEESVYEKIQRNLVDMKTYKCTAYITYISNKSKNEYTAEIFAEDSGKYRIQTSKPDSVSGNVILFDGKMIWHYNPKVESKISVSSSERPERKEIFLFSFLKNYFNSQNVEVETENKDNSSFTILQAIISNEKKYFASEKLWIDNNTLFPSKLVVYDKDGQERIIVTFQDFEYNPKIDEKIFTQIQS